MPDPAHWLLKKVPGWRELERRERKAIRDFPVLWSFFELHTAEIGRHPNATPSRICNAVTELAAVPDTPVINRARAYFASRYFEDHSGETAWSSLRVGEDYVGRVRYGLLDEAADRRSRLLALLLVINRLRNNYLHGEKAAYGFSDQYCNFRHANDVLMFAIELWTRR